MNDDGERNNNNVLDNTLSRNNSNESKTSTLTSGSDSHQSYKSTSRFDNSLSRNNSNESNYSTSTFGYDSHQSHKSPSTRFGHDKIVTESNVFIMFLISHHVAGVIIGRGGDRIRKFSSITKTIISVSHPDELYPGTLLRYVKVNGLLRYVCNTISILWEVVGLEQVENSLNSKNIWYPTDKMTHQFDHVEVEGKLVVPAKTIGYIIGNNKAAIKSMVDSTGAVVHFAKRYEPSLPGHSDRVISVTGRNVMAIR